MQDRMDSQANDMAVQPSLSVAFLGFTASLTTMIALITQSVQFVNFLL